MTTLDFDSQIPATLSALAIFCRAPQWGAGKTRLAATHGASFALALYRAMLCDTFALGRALAPAVETFACFTPAGAFGAELGTLWTGAAFPQSEGDLGVKMLSCLAQLRACGYRRVAVIGSDAPDLPLQFLQRAFVQLNEFNIVVGPSLDGGFYFLGASCALPAAIFADIAWSRDTVFERLQSNLKRLDLSYTTLPAWRDVDEAADLDALRERLKCGQTWAPATLRVLLD